MSNDVQVLEQMSKERDATISELEKERSQQDKRINELHFSLDELKSKQKEASYWHRIEMEELTKQRSALEESLAGLEREMRESSTLHEYANLIRKAGAREGTAAAVDSTYVLRLQSQLCKAMHSMGLMENQMVQVKKFCSDVVKTLKDEISSVVDDKVKVEVELMNRLAALDGDKKQIEESARSDVDKLQREVQELKRKVEELDPPPPSSSSSGPGGTDDAGVQTLVLGGRRINIDNRETSIQALQFQIDAIRSQRSGMEEDLRDTLEERLHSIHELETKNAKLAIEIKKIRAELDGKEYIPDEEPVEPTPVVKEEIRGAIHEEDGYAIKEEDEEDEDDDDDEDDEDDEDEDDEDDDDDYDDEEEERR